jgi:hypothetical protein
MLSGRSVRQNRGTRILEFIDKMNQDAQEDELLHKLSDDEASSPSSSEGDDSDEDDKQSRTTGASTARTSRSGKGSRKAQIARAKAPSGDSTSSSSSYDSLSDSADSDFSDEEEEGRLDSQSSAELERDLRREDKKEAGGGGSGAAGGVHNRKGVSNQKQKKKSREEPVVHRLRKESTISQEDRLRQAAEWASVNQGLLEAQMASFSTAQQSEKSRLLSFAKRKRRRAIGSLGEDEAPPAVRFYSSTKMALDPQYPSTAVLSFATWPVEGGIAFTTKR